MLARVDRKSRVFRRKLRVTMMEDSAEEQFYSPPASPTPCDEPKGDFPESTVVSHSLNSRMGEFALEPSISEVQEAILKSGASDILPEGSGSADADGSGDIVGEIGENGDILASGKPHRTRRRRSKTGGEKLPVEKFVVDANTYTLYPVSENALAEIVSSLESADFGKVKTAPVKDKPQTFHVQFADGELADKAAEKLMNLEYEGQEISIERCQLLPPGVTLPNATLVIKNLPFHLKHDKMMDMLAKMDIHVQSLNFHYDAAGTFRGMAFAKFKAMPDAVKAFDLLNGLDVGGRKIRIEYKRKGSNASLIGLPLKALSSLVPGPLEDFDLDMSDSEIAKVHEQLLRFKENDKLTELAFPPTLSQEEVERIELVAKKLQLSPTLQSMSESRGLCFSKRLSVHRSPGPGKLSLFELKEFDPRDPLLPPRSPPIIKTPNMSPIFPSMSPTFPSSMSPSFPSSMSPNFSRKSQDGPMRTFRRNSLDPHCLIHAWTPPQPQNNDEPRSLRSSGSNSPVGSPPAGSFVSSAFLIPGGRGTGARRMSAPDQSSIVAQLRIPKLPDGTRGFSAGRGKSLKAADDAAQLLRTESKVAKSNIQLVIGAAS